MRPATGYAVSPVPEPRGSPTPSAQADAFQGVEGFSGAGHAASAWSTTCRKRHRLEGQTPS